MPSSTLAFRRPDSARRIHAPGTRSARLAPLRFVSFLAPRLFWFYELVAQHVARRLQIPTEIVAGSSYDELISSADVAFVCGLAYIEMAPQAVATMEPIAAPVLTGERYGNKPIYFSDVVVRRDRPFQAFADLRGRSWAYNEPLSQSGYGITRYFLAQFGETRGYFSKVVEAGSHENALRMIAGGVIDAAAIDSHLLAIVLRDEPALAREVCIIDTLGPSTIQPVAASTRLSPGLRSELSAALVGMADDPAVAASLERALVSQFAPVGSADYDDIRSMRDTAIAAGLTTLI